MPEFEPIRFHNDARELFGLYLPSAASVRRRHAVLLCSPFGQEAIRASRLYRVLGDRLQAAGFDVLRFDYYGTGDSAGDDAEFDLDGAVRDAVRAAALLRERSTPARLSFAGLRLGASIAALASAELPQGLDHLVLFEPIDDGPAYLSALAEANRDALAGAFSSRWSIDAGLRAFNLPGDDTESLGFATTPAMRAQLALRLPPGGRWPGQSRALHILAADGQTYASWRNTAGTTRVVVQPSRSDIDWATNSALNNAIVPRPWIEALLAALDEVPANA